MNAVLCDRPARVRTAVALARRIRWSPERLAAADYPPGMSCATTCCCHIVVDDPNFADEHAASCLALAKENDHAECEQLARILVESSRRDREAINRFAWADD